MWKTGETLVRPQSGSLSSPQCLGKYQGLVSGLILYLLLTATLAVYWPGLDGTFLFDTVPNLNGLQLVNAYDDSTGVWRFVLEGRSSPLGRPLARLSFLLNDTHWPPLPWSFKYTNLLLHLLNGVLIFWLALVLARLSGLQTWRIHATAILTSAFWLLHPFNASTVLYVVQRMTELATLFMLGGILAYIHGRLFVTDRPRSGYLWMSFGIALGGVLAILSKEIGILLPLYVLIIEYTLIRSTSIVTPAGWRAWSSVFLFLPLLLLIGFHVYKFGDYLTLYNVRDYGMYERLLTQPRVLMDYLANIAIPRRAGTGVFHDDFITSRSLFEFRTLSATVAVMSMLAAAVIFRKKYSVLSFGILWFFAGHLLESGILPLEHYFEHRNYLPMMGPLFAAAYYVINSSNKYLSSLVSVSLLFIILAAFVTLQQAQWARIPLLNAMTLANDHPLSVRAHQNAARQWANMRGYDQAEDQLRKILTFHPQSTAAHMLLIHLGCLRSDPPLPATEMNKHISHIRQGDWETSAGVSLMMIAQLHSKGHCKLVTKDDLIRLVDALIDNPHFFTNFDLANLWYVKSVIYEQDKNLEQAIFAMQRSYEYEPTVDYALAEIKLLVSAGYLDEALAATEKAYRADKSRIPGLRLRKKDIEYFYDQILKIKKNQGH